MSDDVEKKKKVKSANGGGIKTQEIVIYNASSITGLREYDSYCDIAMSDEYNKKL